MHIIRRHYCIREHNSINIIPIPQYLHFKPFQAACQCVLSFPVSLSLYWSIYISQYHPLSILTGYSYSYTMIHYATMQCLHFRPISTYLHISLFASLHSVGKWSDYSRLDLTGLIKYFLCIHIKHPFLLLLAQCQW